MKSTFLTIAFICCCSVALAQDIRQSTAAQIGGSPVEVSLPSSTGTVQHTSPAIGQPALEVALPPATGTVQTTQPALPPRDPEKPVADKPKG